jgi:hypothetical protein
VPLGGVEKREAIGEAQTAEDMWKAVGVDSWVVVPIESISRTGHQLEGTRLTLVRLEGQPDSYEFSIRTPVTPSRWSDYDQVRSQACLCDVHVLLMHSCTASSDMLTVAPGIRWSGIEGAVGRAGGCTDGRRPEQHRRPGAFFCVLLVQLHALGARHCRGGVHHHLGDVSSSRHARHGTNSKGVMSRNDANQRGPMHAV